MSPHPDRFRLVRVGVMCRGTTFPAWQARALRELVGLEGVKVASLMVQEREVDRIWRILRRLSDLRHMLWNLYNKGYVERRSRASRPVDLTAELANVPVMYCQTEAVGKYGERFTPPDLERIRDHDLDLILRFGFGILKGGVLASARYGVWSFHHGDERRYRGRPPAFWEIVDGEPIVGSVLQRLTERLDAGVVLHRGFFKCTPHSYVRTRDEALLGSAVWPSIVVRQIQSGDVSIFDSAPSTTTAPVRRDPGNVVVVKFLIRQAVAFLKSQWRSLTRAAKWSVGIASAPIEEFLNENVPEITWLPEQPGTRYLADPFPHREGGAFWVLVEEYDYRTRRGVVSVLDMRDGSVSPVLDLDVHTSYPYLFEYEGELYCVPETYQANEVRIYRAIRFPDEWEHLSTPLRGMAALDPTLFRHQDRWWLMCTDHVEGPNTKLHVFHSRDLLGPWEPHALNPVKTDIRSARPAGTPFITNGRLYRPAQDGSTGYGGAVSIARVDELTPARFTETIVRRVFPPGHGPYRAGIHTLSAAGSETLVDGRRDTFILAAFREELRARFRLLTAGRPRDEHSPSLHRPGAIRS